MGENPPRVSRTKPNNNGPTTTNTTTKGGGSRFTTTVEDGGAGGDQTIECSGKFCRSCTAGLIADCVALCCCPCAVVHCFALAFVKAPWVVGRRCLGLGSKNKKVTHKRKCKRGSEDFDGGGGVVLERNREGNLMRVASSNNVGNVGRGVVGELESVTVNAGFEAEKVWLELYQIGHLDFGRVSFSEDS